MSIGAESFDSNGRANEGNCLHRLAPQGVRVRIFGGRGRGEDFLGERQKLVVEEAEAGPQNLFFIILYIYIYIYMFNTWIEKNISYENISLMTKILRILFFQRISRSFDLLLILYLT